jgi:hypothetical protein
MHGRHPDCGDGAFHAALVVKRRLDCAAPGIEGDDAALCHRHRSAPAASTKGARGDDDPRDVRPVSVLGRRREWDGHIRRGNPRYAEAGQVFAKACCDHSAAPQLFGPSDSRFQLSK